MFQIDINDDFYNITNTGHDITKFNAYDFRCRKCGAFFHVDDGQPTIEIEYDGLSCDEIRLKNFFDE